MNKEGDQTNEKRRRRLIKLIKKKVNTHSIYDIILLKIFTN